MIGSGNTGASDLPPHVYMKGRPSRGHPEGEVEAGWWLMGETLRKDRKYYVIAKPIEGQNVRFEVVPAAELEEIQKQVWAAELQTRQKAGHRVVGTLMVADNGHQLPTVFGYERKDAEIETRTIRPKPEGVAVVAVDQLRGGVAADRLQQIAWGGLRLIKERGDDFLAIVSVIAQALDNVQREYSLSEGEVVQLKRCVQVLQGMNEAAWMPEAARNREYMKVQGLLQSLL